jgi:hypothetical protein
VARIALLPARGAGAAAKATAAWFGEAGRVILHAMRGAASGFLAWGLIALATAAGRTSLGAIAALFLLSPLVLVPLGFEVVRGIAGELSPPGRMARLLLPIGSALAALSFWPPAGPTAGLFAMGWALVCTLAAIEGLLRLVRVGHRSVEGVCSSAGFVYLFVGSVWLVLSRRGATPFHYPALTVLLAAVHFHFTGFALPIVAAATARARRSPGGSAGPGLLFPLVAAGILLGPALLAAGNVRQSPAWKLVGALLLVAASIGLAGLLASALRLVESRPARWLLAIAALSLVPGMALVAVYAFGELSTHRVLVVSQMALFHGTINALGVSLCGLLGWALEGRQRAGRRAASRP